MTREEAERLGKKTEPIKHSMKRRATWHNYSRPGWYLITIRIKADEDGRYYLGQLLSEVKGDSRLLPPRMEIDSSYLLTNRKNRQTVNANTVDCDPAYPHTVLSPMGRLIDAKVRQIPLFKQFGDVEVVNHVCMPSHIHILFNVRRGLPYYVARKRQYHFGDLIDGFKSGCTSIFKRWLQGESEEALMGFINEQSECLRTGRKMERIYSTIPGGKSEVSLWEEGYNDRNLLDDESIGKAFRYIDLNPWRLKVIKDNPSLLEHLLCISISGVEYSAFGCMFLLRQPFRERIMCHRYVRKGWLTEYEWEVATRPDVADRLEREARENSKRMGRWNYDWKTTTNPEALCPIPYEKTEHFRKLKDETIKRGLNGVVFVSPARSEGEKQIFYGALEAGCRCIKLYMNPMNRRDHPYDSDIQWCQSGQLLTMGPWEIKQQDYFMKDGTQISHDSMFAKCHDLNVMALDLASNEVGPMTWRIVKK